jgi:putative flippase GtrA
MKPLEAFMLQKIRPLIEKYWDILSYLFFGVLTTAVNYVVYLPCYNLLHLSAAVSNAIAWVAAVAFAYLTNKPFVFKSYDWSLKTVLPELAKFVGCRVGSGALETAILFLCVDLLQWNGNVWKLVTSVLVVIINYVASKLLVFTKREK